MKRGRLVVVVVEAGVVDCRLRIFSSLVTMFCSRRNGAMEGPKMRFLNMLLEGEMLTSPMIVEFTRLSTTTHRQRSKSTRYSDILRELAK